MEATSGHPTRTLRGRNTTLYQIPIFASMQTLLRAQACGSRDVAGPPLTPTVVCDTGGTTTYVHHVPCTTYHVPYATAVKRLLCWPRLAAHCHVNVERRLSKATGIYYIRAGAAKVLPERKVGHAPQKPWVRIWVCFLTRCWSCTQQQMESLCPFLVLLRFDRYDQCNGPNYKGDSKIV